MTSHYLRETINRRAKTLVTLIPVFDLQRNASGVSVADIGTLDVLRVISEILDAVITGMSGAWGGVSYEELQEAIMPRLSALAPGMSRENIERVLAYIVDGLLNQKERDSFKLNYQYEHEDGSIERAKNIFKLLKETHDPAPPHRIRLQATAEAINLHLASFAVDIEAAEAAEQAMVHHFVQHGKHREAGMAAKRAFERSLQFRQKIGQLLHLIERHVVDVDYDRDFAPVLVEAREQLEKRLSVDAQLLTMVEDLIPQSGSADRADLISTRNHLQLAYKQHEALCNEVITASQRFLDETLRQRFRRLASASLVHPWNDIALPLLRKKTNEIAVSFSTAAWTFFAISAPRPLNISALVNLMLQERELDNPAQIPDPVQIINEDILECFSAEDYASLSKHLRELKPPIRLNEALAALRAAGASENVQRLFVLQAGLWFVGDEDGQPIVRCLDELLDDSQFYGNNLLLLRQ